MPGILECLSGNRGTLPNRLGTIRCTLFLEFEPMKILHSSLLLLAVLGMTSIGCGQPATPPASTTPAATEEAGSTDKEAPAEGEAKEDAGSEKKEG
jgi:hypothetical protein